MPSSHETLMELLFELHQSLSGHLKEFTRKERLPVVVFAVMGQITREPGVTVSHLARTIGISKSRVSTIVDKLSREGHVEKRSDPNDKRLIRLYPAPKAFALWKQKRQMVQQHLAGLAAEFPLDQTGQLIDLLTRLKAVIDKQSNRE